MDFLKCIHNYLLRTHPFELLSSYDLIFLRSKVLPYEYENFQSELECFVSCLNHPETRTKYSIGAVTNSIICSGVYIQFYKTRIATEWGCSSQHSPLQDMCLHRKYSVCFIYACVLVVVGEFLTLKFLKVVWYNFWSQELYSNFSFRIVDHNSLLETFYHATMWRNVFVVYNCASSLRHPHLGYDMFCMV